VEHKKGELGLSMTSRYAGQETMEAKAGKMDEAKTALAEARRLNPTLTVKWMIEHGFDFPAVSDGLRKAGLQEE